MELEFNKVYKYKELCEACNVKPTTNREKVIKAISQKYDIEKVGRGEYIVHRQLSEEDKIIKGWSTKFTSYIEYMLIDMLQQTDEHQLEIHLSYREIMEKFKMVNEHYFPVKYKKEQFEIIVNNIMDDGLIIANERLWFSISSSMLIHIIDRAIKSIEGRKLIIANKGYRYGKRIDIDGTTVNTVHNCTPDECSKILGIEEKVLRRNGLKKQQDLFKLDKFHADKIRMMQHNAVKYEMQCDWYTKTYVILKGSTFHQYPLRAMRQEIGNDAGRLFNQNIVDNMLNSKTMSNVAQSINEQLTYGLIKK